MIEENLSNVHFKIHGAKKALLASVVITIETTEKNLLQELLHQFVVEKSIDIGMNPNNKATNMIAKETSLFVRLPDPKVLNFVLLLFRYLMTMEISGNAKKYCIMKKSSYTKLHDDIKKGMNVIVTGKCFGLINKISSKHKQIENFKKAIELAGKAAKKSDDIPANGQPDYYKSRKVTLSPMAMLYVAILGQKYDFYFSKDEIVCSDGVWEELCFFFTEMPSKIFNGKVKSWMQQYGRPKTVAAANDKGGEKMKKFNADLLESVNMEVELISKLFGIKPQALKSLAGADKAITNEIVSKMKKEFKILMKPSKEEKKEESPKKAEKK